jgi:hypothetical protein
MAHGNTGVISFRADAASMKTQCLEAYLIALASTKASVAAGSLSAPGTAILKRFRHRLGENFRTENSGIPEYKSPTF